MGAVQVAAAGLAPQHHDEFASFLATMAGHSGAHMALLGLPGLSLEMEVELCMVTGEGGKGGKGVWVEGEGGKGDRGDVQGGRERRGVLREGRGVVEGGEVVRNEVMPWAA